LRGLLFLFFRARGGAGHPPTPAGGPGTGPAPGDVPQQMTAAVEAGEDT
jgi:hypothetical protein